MGNGGRSTLWYTWCRSELNLNPLGNTFDFKECNITKALDWMTECTSSISNCNTYVK